MRTLLGWAIIVAGIGWTTAGCAEQEDAPPDEQSVATPLVNRLTPPAAYVLASDGTTKQTLEQAGILRAGGRQAALALGKALFWDEQAGSDGNACASCHLAAGADLRITNQLSPGHNDVTGDGTGDKTFGSLHSDNNQVDPGEMPSGGVAGPNITLQESDFPLHRLTNVKDRNSPIHSTTNDAVSSQGSFAREFVKGKIMGTPDKCEINPAGLRVGAHGVRQVEPRNTPTVINAAFFHSNFWDGRANNLFNGVGVFGLRDIAGDPNARLIVVEDGVPTLGFLQVRNASLASQSVGPPLSALEMSCAGRTFPDVGRRLLKSIPLFKQRVASDDSVLGPYASPSGKGLRPQHRYEALIKSSFDAKYWSAPGRYRIVDGQLVSDPQGYTQMEINFSMFWGLSIMLYEQTLISDQSRFDDWFESCRPSVGPGVPATAEPPIANPVVRCNPAPGNPITSWDPTQHPMTNKFTAQEVLGFGLFNNGGIGIRSRGNPACGGCHPVPGIPLNFAPVIFPTFSEAAFQEGTNFVPVERSLVIDPGFPLATTIEGGVHDRGFFNLGLRPANDDLGNGRLDPYGNPLSISRMFLLEQAGNTVVDPTGITNRCNTPGLIEPGGTPRFADCPAPPTPPPANPPPLDISLERQLVDGGFKTPSIRNVGLTPPYFHYGGYSSLRSVVEVYARGGSARHMQLTQPGATGDWSGTGRLGFDTAPAAGPDFGTNVDFFIRDLKSTDEQIDALVAFMLTTTDPRVQCDKAPFDHPELTVSNGHSDADQNHDGAADDITFTLPAVGASGYKGAKARYCIPNTGNLFADGMGARRGD